MGYSIDWALQLNRIPTIHDTRRLIANIAIQKQKKKENIQNRLDNYSTIVFSKMH